MSDEKMNVSHREHDLESNNGGLHRSMTTVTLTPAQFEALYLQPSRSGGSLLARKLGNAAPLGVSAFLLAHLPLTFDLLGFQSADANSGLAILGAFYACAGFGLYAAGIFEFIVGNTFPMVVFITFGGFWTTYGILIQPSFRVAAGFAPANLTDTTFAGVTSAAAGSATRSYNSGVGLYFVVWTLLCFLYTVAALRTNATFVVLFGSLTVALALLAAGHFHTGVGELSTAATDFKSAGALAFVTGLAGLYLDISLIFKAVDFPISIPVGDLSSLRFMQPRQTKEQQGAKERSD
ncbi:hypothetical protein K439DRAFT_1631833 [Ramaria rubella]|nr:hypothetical protein K439DRAFT_1631833 [Ramaria rubella]